MSEAFAERVRTASITADGDALNAWRAAVEEWHSAIERSQALDLVRFVLDEAPTDGLTDYVLSNLPAEAPGKVEPGEIHLQRLLAAEALIALLDDGGPVATQTALVLECAAFSGRTPVQPALLTVAAGRLRRASVEAYELPAISNVTAAPSSYKTAVAALSEAELNAHHTALTEIAAELNRVRNTLIRFRGNLMASQMVLRTRADMLWLAISPTSPSLGVPLADLDPAARPLAAALDLFVAAPVAPGPIITPRLLAHNLAHGKSDVEERYTITDAVEQLGSFKSAFPKSQEQFRGLLPILERIDPEAGPNGNDEIPHSVQELAEELYRELLVNTDE